MPSLKTNAALVVAVAFLWGCGNSSGNSSTASPADLVLTNAPSDVIASVRRASPFLGIQIGHTRQEAALGAAAPITPPETQRLTLEQTLVGYTWNAAYQQGWEERLGSIEDGKIADLVVLDRDIFNIDPYEISETMPTAVMVDGQITQGSLGQ